MVQGSKLKEYRRARKVGQTELSAELGKKGAYHICRLERRDLSDLDFTRAIAAVEAIVDRRQRAAGSPVDAAPRAVAS